MFLSLAGSWDVKLNDGSVYQMVLPGTLDENQIGYQDHGSSQWHADSELGNEALLTGEGCPIATRFTRKYTYEGPAEITKSVELEERKDTRSFLFAERARCLQLWIDEEKVEHFRPETISTPHVFEISEYMDGKEHRIRFVSDNSYPGLPQDAITNSSAATDETQTNWNGILGKFGIFEEPKTFISNIRILPKDGMLTVFAAISSCEKWRGTIQFSSDTLIRDFHAEIEVQEGLQEIAFPDLKIRESIRKWDEYEGHLYQFSTRLENGSRKETLFGVRDFQDLNGRLGINGRTIFLRGETNCAEYPETGHVPMEKAEWIRILNTYKSYGINCVRFHSHCPSEAAFEAADEMGMLVQPELSHWNPKDAFEQEESNQYYRTELLEIVRTYANHPSFVMLTFGNELQAHENGMDRMHELLDAAHKLDDTRMYAISSNAFYGEKGVDHKSDFFTSVGYYQDELRGTFAAFDQTGIKGHINRKYPGTMTNYDTAMNHLRTEYRKPVFSFEVGQFEVLPDFGELAKFRGISDPVNYKLIQDKVIRNGLTDVWKDYVEATGELANICYREEIEAAMRTESMSGISLLSLQDFPGQGTALVGMLDSHLEAKPYAFAAPERFASFFSDTRLLLKMPKYTYENTETFSAEVVAVNFGKKVREGSVHCKFVIDGQRAAEVVMRPITAECGTYTSAGTLEVPLDFCRKAARIEMILEMDGITSDYPVWVYPEVHPICPEEIYETEKWDEKAQAVLENGGKVYLTPQSREESFCKSIQAQFSTDFWSVGTFSAQEGGMGQLIDRDHPIFSEFPTEKHSNWQWWAMAGQRAMILPKKYRAIITEMDSYAYMRPMAQLIEANCLNGKIIISSLGLQKLQHYPEARALLKAIYSYMASEKFTPTQTISVSEIEQMIKRTTSQE